MKTISRLASIYAVLIILPVATYFAAAAPSGKSYPQAPAAAAAPTRVAEAPETWHVFDPSGTRVDNPAFEAIAGQLPPGQFTVDLVPTPGQKRKQRFVTITEKAQPPVVVVPDPVTPVDPTVPPVVKTGVSLTYVFEKDQSAVPSSILVTFDRLNRAKTAIATSFEVDTKDGDGDVPDQYKLAVAAAVEAGLPALVAVQNGKVLKVVRDPKTDQQIYDLLK